MVAPKSARMSRLRAWMTRPALALASLMLLPAAVSATEVAVSFRDVGYGTFGGSQLQNIANPQSLLGLPGISKVEFVQDTASGRFEAIQTGCNSQGNDVAVTVRLTADPALINGVTGGHISFLGCVNWLDQPGGKIEGFGFMQPIGGSFTIDYITGSDVTFARTDTNIGTNMFADLTVSGGSKTYPFTGAAADSFIGSANFKPAALVDELNRYYAATTNVAVPAIELVKTASISGDVITYTFKATNTGNVTLTNVKAVELSAANETTYGGTKFSGTGTAPVPAGMVLTDNGTRGDSTNSGVDQIYDSLAVGDTVTWTASYTLTQADKDAGGVTNQAVALGTAPSGTADAVQGLSDDGDTGSSDTGTDPTVTQFTRTPGLTVTKSTSDSTLSNAAVGTVVNYTITVKNTGNVSLTGVTLTDALTTDEAWSASDGGDLNGAGTLNVGETWTYTASYTLVQADIDAGRIENVAYATATPPSGPAVTAYSGANRVASTSSTAPTTGNGVVTTITPNPKIEMVKTSSLSGDVITYSFAARNVGNVTLSNVKAAEILTDSNASTYGGTKFSGTGTAPVPAEMGLIDNAPSGGSTDAGGNQIYDTLAVGDTVTWTASYTLTQADKDAGRVSNQAVALGTAPNGTADAVKDTSDDTGAGADATVTQITAAPALRVTKSTTSTTLSNATVGTVINYTITVENTGNVTMSSVVLADEKTSGATLTTVTGVTDDNKLNVGETWTYTASYTLVQADIDAGKVENIASATATPPAGSAVKAYSGANGVASTSATAPTADNGVVTTITPIPQIEMVKTSSLSGNVITYTYAATNTGNVTLSNVKATEILTDSDASTYGGTKFSGTGTAPVPAGMVLTDNGTRGDSTNSGADQTYDRLAVGDKVTWTATYTLTQADKDAGGVTNQAVALGTAPGGTVDAVNDPSDDTGAGSDATVTLFTAQPALTVTKSTTESTLTAAEVGTEIHYTITVKNTGNVTMSSVELADEKTSGATLTEVTGVTDDNKLNVGETWTYTASYALEQADIDAGKVENVASATATPPSGSDVTAYSGANGVASTSSTAPTAGHGVITTIAPVAGLTVTKSTTSTTLADAEVGTVIDYTITVKNTGNVSLTGVTLTDALTTDEAWSASDRGDLTAAGTLNVGETWTYTASYTLEQADIDAGKVENIAAATGTPPSGPNVTAYSGTNGTPSTSSTAPTAGNGVVTTITPVAGLTVTKSTTSTTLSNATVGTVINYTITVENTGNVTLSSVVLTDKKTSGATLTAVTGVTDDNKLNVGETWTYTASYALVQADIDAGKVENVASAKGTTPSRSEVTAYSGANGVASTSSEMPEDGDGVVTTITPVPGLTVTKSTNSATLSNAAVGTVIDYTITVENTGNVSLTGVTLTDELTDGATFDESTNIGADEDTGAEGDTLNVGEIWTYTASYTLVQSDIDAGKVENIAAATATPPSGSEVTAYSGANGVASTSPVQPEDGDGVVTTITRTPSLKITKTVDESDLADGVRPGDVLAYTIKVENTGNVTLNQVALTDTFTAGDETTLSLDEPGVTLQTTPAVDVNTLAVGEVWTYTASYTLTAETIGTGGVENIAVVDAEAPDGTPISAESKVGGNTSADGQGTPTGTGFPGEISGSVKSYLAGVKGVTVRLLKLVGSDYEPVLDEDDNPITAETDDDGNYVFVNVPAGTYGVEFDEPDDSNLSTSSPTAEEEGNRIIGIVVDAGAVEVDQDAFFVDPSGIVYNTETLAPISGATVTLYYNGSPVDNSWLNTTLGQPNGSVTDSSGAYFYLFDPTHAQSGTYTLVVEKTGYKVSDTVLPAAPRYEPELGGGVEKIVDNDLPDEGSTQTYYLTFEFTFGDDPANTSNGIANNHIPLDRKILDDVKEDVIDILKDDLTATMAQQGARMQGYAAGALDRLKSRDGGSCKAELDAALRGEQILFTPASAEIREESGAILDQLAEILKLCEGTTFEVAGHTDSNGSDAENMALSQARVNAVVAALDERGVNTRLLTGIGYGESRPIADNATPSGQARNRRIEFVLPDMQSAEEGCVNGASTDHDLSANAQGEGADLSGNFSREYRDCATDSWRIVEGDLSVMRMDTGIDQSMVNLSLRKERFVNDNRVRGRFVGGYASRSAVTGTGEGDILGFGLNAGLYGADRLSAGLFFDYYLGVAAGRHTFDLNFDRFDGVINATGYYTYGAAFAGAALSGEMKAKSLDLTPRAGFELAWSPGGNGQLTATRAQLIDSESITIPAVMGLRAFVELGIEDLLEKSPWTLSVTPRLLCDWGQGGISMGCGYGGSIELTTATNKDGESFALGLEGSKTSKMTSGSVSLRYQKAIGNGKLQGGVTTSTSGDPSIEAGYAVDF